MKLVGQHFEHPPEDALLAPVLKAPVHRRRRSVAGRQIAPLRAGAQDPQHSVQRRAGIGPRSSGAAGEFLRRNELLQEIPLMVGKVHP